MVNGLNIFEWTPSDTSNDRQQAPLGMSDADFEIGHHVMPGKRVHLNPNLTVHSATTLRRTLESFAARLRASKLALGKLFQAGLLRHMCAEQQVGHPPSAGACPPIEGVP